MSKHTVVTPPADEIDGGSMYAESIVIDEGGVDLKIDGETIISASFDGIDPYRLAYEVLPESFGFPFPQKETEDQWHATLAELVKETGNDDFADVEIELLARLFLTALAERNGYAKK